MKSLSGYVEVEPMLWVDYGMKALILDGSREEDSGFNNIIDNIINVLKESSLQVEIITLRSLGMSSCLGCFGCWIKTPGICVIDDIGRTIAMKAVQSDLLILFTPIIFGGYSSELKKALDRMIPNMLPFYTKIDGEIHHYPRYEKYPKIIGIGFLPSQDQVSENIFEKLIERNSINFYCEKYSSRVIYPDDTPESIHEKMTKALAELNE